MDAPRRIDPREAARYAAALVEAAALLDRAGGLAVGAAMLARESPEVGMEEAIDRTGSARSLVVRALDALDRDAAESFGRCLLDRLREAPEAARDPALAALVSGLRAGQPAGPLVVAVLLTQAREAIARREERVREALLRVPVIKVPT